MKAGKGWDTIINSKAYRFSFKEIFAYKDLLFLFVKRDFISIYKQTILGPVWFFIQPILTTITFSVIFGRIAGISTDGVPPLLFYLSGVILWNYFQDTLTKTSNTFVANAQVFGKVYFPRVIVPLSIVISNMLKLGVQFLLFISFMIYYSVVGSLNLQFHLLWLLPILILMMAFLGMGIGLIISSLTTKYRDLKFLVQFGVQLLMYASPIVYPLSTVEGKLKTIILANPVSSIIETFKHIFLGTGHIYWEALLYSFVFMITCLLMGVFIFNRVEKNFMDTV